MRGAVEPVALLGRKRLFIYSQMYDKYPPLEASAPHPHARLASNGAEIGGPADNDSAGLFVDSSQSVQN